MTPMEIIKEVSAAGVRLTLTRTGAVMASGKKAAVLYWLPIMREQIVGVITGLRYLNYGPEEQAADSVSRWWRIRYPDRLPFVVLHCPPANHDEVLAGHVDAVAVEPFDPIRRPPVTPVTVEEEAAIRRWLVHIQETDEAGIANVLDQCNTDTNARKYFLSQADVITK